MEVYFSPDIAQRISRDVAGGGDKGLLASRSRFPSPPGGASVRVGLLSWPALGRLGVVPDSPHAVATPAPGDALPTRRNQEAGEVLATFGSSSDTSEGMGSHGKRAPQTYI